MGKRERFKEREPIPLLKSENPGREEYSDWTEDSIKSFNSSLGHIIQPEWPLNHSTRRQDTWSYLVRGTKGKKNFF